MQKKDVSETWGFLNYWTNLTLKYHFISFFSLENNHYLNFLHCYVNLCLVFLLCVAYAVKISVTYIFMVIPAKCCMGVKFHNILDCMIVCVCHFLFLLKMIFFILNLLSFNNSPLFIRVRYSRYLFLYDKQISKSFSSNSWFFQWKYSWPRYNLCYVS